MNCCCGSDAAATAGFRPEPAPTLVDVGGLDLGVNAGWLMVTGLRDEILQKAKMSADMKAGTQHPLHASCTDQPCSMSCSSNSLLIALGRTSWLQL